MLIVDCPDHGSPVLVSERRIRSLRNTDHGILLTVACWCGTLVQLRTGRHQEQEQEQGRDQELGGHQEQGRDQEPGRHQELDGHQEPLPSAA